MTNLNNITISELMEKSWFINKLFQFSLFENKNKFTLDELDSIIILLIFYFIAILGVIESIIRKLQK
jgi:hypothetical protein